MELELSGINAHGVVGAYRPLPEHLVCMVLSYIREVKEHLPFAVSV